jgi:hypothetical protein
MKRIVSLLLLAMQMQVMLALPAVGAVLCEQAHWSRSSAGSSSPLADELVISEQPQSPDASSQKPRPKSASTRSAPKQQGMSGRTKKILLFVAILGSVLAIGAYSASQTR